MTLFEILEKYMGIFLTVHLKDTRIEENLLQSKQADARYIYYNSKFLATVFYFAGPV